MNVTIPERVHAVWTRREALIAGAALVAAPFLARVTSTVQAAQAAEWLSYGGDKASSKYSPVDQIGRDNFSRLQVAWT
jgi:glucose dehydrogenase